ncbi:hemolysin [Salinispira pacifica]|uniref:Putative hemolysin n=1 Tax=Salinispira pacifica TaxID=1307761 RepID=V5WL31_9SPIO|nr:hemolysin [Salinispira pacifica]AHC15901.1 Putative hemolysin [Salinispira pacifica]
MIGLALSLLGDLSSSLPVSSVFHRMFMVIYALPGIFRITLDLYRFDRKIRHGGLQKAAGWLYNRFYRELDLPPDHRTLLERPAQPCLYVSNHPGIGDSLALLSQIPTENLKILVKSRRFFHMMPELKKYLILLSPSSRQRIPQMRRARNHLRDGGSLLMYPAGEIEPDPDLDPLVFPAKPGHWEFPELRVWSRFPRMLLRDFSRNGQELSVRCCRVSSVYHRRYFRHPFVLSAPTMDDALSRAAFLSIVYPRRMEAGVRLRVQAGLSESFSCRAPLEKREVLREKAPIPG